MNLSIGIFSELSSKVSIRTAIDATNRTTFILVGLETDVCVAQSALGLKAAGYRAVVVEDATASPPPHHSLATVASFRTA